MSVKDFIDVGKKNFSKTDGLLYAMLYVYIVTFIVFPGVATKYVLKFFDSFSNAFSWSFVFILTVYSIFDSIGRKLGSIEKFDVDPLGIKIMSLSRTFFILTFMFIAFNLHPTFVFHSSVFIILNLILFSFSHGYIQTLCAVKAPETVPPEERG